MTTYDSLSQSYGNKSFWNFSDEEKFLRFSKFEKTDIDISYLGSESDGSTKLVVPRVLKQGIGAGNHSEYTVICFVANQSANFQNSFELLEQLWYDEKTWMQGIVANLNIPKDPKNELFNKVESFSELQPGWASEGSLAPTPIAISQARQFIDLLPSGTQLPHVSVAEDGEINFFWHSESSYIDVGIYGDNKIHYYVESEAAGIDKDGIEPLSTSSLPKDVISAIASF